MVQAPALPLRRSLRGYSKQQELLLPRVASRRVVPTSGEKHCHACCTFTSPKSFHFYCSDLGSAWLELARAKHQEPKTFFFSFLSPDECRCKSAAMGNIELRCPCQAEWLKCHFTSVIKNQPTPRATSASFQRTPPLRGHIHPLLPSHGATLKVAAS